MFSHTIRETSTVHGPLSRSAGRQVAALSEFDVEAAQVGLQSGVLDGDQVRRGVSLKWAATPRWD
jgi:hypothetical protein